MTRLNRILLVIALLLLAALTVLQFMPDEEPPRLELDFTGSYHVVREDIISAPAHEALSLELSFSETVRLDLSFAEQSFAKNARDRNFNIELFPSTGEQVLYIRARDRGNNVLERSIRLHGLGDFRPLASIPSSLARAEAGSFNMRLPASSYGFDRESFVITANGTPLQLYRTDNAYKAFYALGLTDEATELLLRLESQDHFDRRFYTEYHIPIEEQEAQEASVLDFDTALLAIRSEENLRRELEQVQSAFEQYPDNPTPLWTQPFMLPIAGSTSSGFGLLRQYGVGGSSSYHSGTDIAAPEGTEILATNDGLVVVADFFPIRGGLVVIDHGAGLSSHYFHQSRFLVEPGDYVFQGDIIGEVGTTGLSTGPHLHWEMQVNFVATDPMLWVGRLEPAP